jgi:hypothetical protein
MVLPVTVRTWKLLDRATQLSWAIATCEQTDFFSIRDQVRFVLQGSRAVEPPEFCDYIREIFSLDLLQDGLNRPQNLNDFVHSMPEWIFQNSVNKITGLDQYQADFSSGTTQSFDSFYYRYRSRRMRCFVGEYFYHLKTWISNNTPWSMISDADPLTAGDALVVSLPFCDTGTQLENFDQVLEKCNQLGIPVLVDCCYYFISRGVSADLSADCIDTVTFSLSKAFTVARLRIGVRFTKPDIFDGQKLHHSTHYNNSLSAWVGLKIIQKFSSDYIAKLYQEKQRQVCEYLGLTPSQSVIFAIGDADWNQYNRSGLLHTYKLDLDADQFQNRICLSAIYNHWDLFSHLQNETTS